MIKMINKYISLVLILILTLIMITSCIFKLESISYTYEELSKDLIKIDYAIMYDSSSEKHTDIYKTLNSEEQEQLLLAMEKIVFKEQFATNFPHLRGDAFIFYYPTYELYITKNVISKSYYEGYDNTPGEILVYHIQLNEQYEKLIDTFKCDK